MTHEKCYKNQVSHFDVGGYGLCHLRFTPVGIRQGKRIGSDGEALFQAKCSPCHTIGGGRLVGPDLKGVTALRDHAWLANFISAPDRVLAGGDPIASRLLKEYGGVAMPNLGLNHSQVDELITYLAESSPQKSTLHPAGAAEAIAGDPQARRQTFHRYHLIPEGWRTLPRLPYGQRGSDTWRRLARP